MREMTSSVKTVEVPGELREIQRISGQQLKALRETSVPQVGLVNNFDVDQREFLTAPFKGFTMVQKGAGAGTYGTLAVQADYGAIPPDKTQTVRPVPGQPVLVYPVAAQSGSFNTSFIRTGGTDSKRIYPVQLLTRNRPTTVRIE